MEAGWNFRKAHAFFQLETVANITIGLVVIIAVLVVVVVFGTVSTTDIIVC